MDLRKRKSQDKLQLALAQHLQSKTIDEITIGELTKTAGVSRQTFYSNFDSKQSILLNRIEKLFEKTRCYFESLVPRTDIKRSEFVELGMHYLLSECEKEKTLMCAAFTGQAGIRCLSLLNRLSAKIIADRVLLLYNYNFDAKQLDLIADFYAGAMIGSIQGWLLDDSGAKDMESVVTHMSQLMSRGLNSFIVRYED